jgi:hypothetical protein
VKYLPSQKYDNKILGTILGLIDPFIVFILFYLIMYHGMSMRVFIHYMGVGEIFVPTLSLCVAGINLLTFFICIWTNREKSAWGILQATFVYAIIICIVKLTAA